MQRTGFNNERKVFSIGPRLVERLIYVPGAAILLYGIWLALTV